MSTIGSSKRPLNAEAYQAAVVETYQEILDLQPLAVKTLHRNMTCGDPKVEVEAARLAFEQAYLAQSAYSMVGYFSNNTPYTLTLKSHSTNGDWAAEPDQSVGPGGSTKWSANYDGFQMDTRVTYTSDKGDVELILVIPLFGDNTVQGNTTIGGCTVGVEGGRGWHATAFYTLDK